MTSPPRRFLGSTEAARIPNVSVDGAPNANTVLSLTHWPGVAQPPGYGDDLSAQMVFRYLDEPLDHPPAEVVTCDHFDQDGLVSLFALIDPPGALEHRDLLIDLAGAGDFAVYRDRRAARASMTLWAYATSELSPLAGPLAELEAGDGYDLLFAETLPLVLDMLLDSERFEQLWIDEDRDLTASEEMVASGAIAIEERADLDLATVTVPADLDPVRGHRFGAGAMTDGPLHPMAVNNASTCLRRLVVHGHRYRYVDRYESWVQYRSRRPRPRVDLRPLAEELTALETDGTIWRATAPGALRARLETEAEAESSLDPDAVGERLADHLTRAEPAWDPYTVR